ncbi:MAG: hypothetical protein HY217_02310 [Candidatus Rokubacteria bacterium]|nr:hypothetical protein [Candidatus Rokubacteria bacterium]
MLRLPPLADASKARIWLDRTRAVVCGPKERVVARAAVDYHRLRWTHSLLQEAS